MNHFFVSPGQIDGHRITITGPDVNHIKNVLRMKIGEELSVSNGIDGREYRCGILSFADDAVLCELRFIKEESHELPSKIFLFQGLPKADKMETVIQKTTELGVFEIIPVAMKRSVVRLDEKKSAQKISRWQGIAEAAAKQSRRGVIPKIMTPVSFSSAIEYAGENCDVLLFPYELAGEASVNAVKENTGLSRDVRESTCTGMAHTREVFSTIRPGQNVAVFIGPEGGFDEGEVALAREAGFSEITLGKRILRTETAGVCVLSVLMYLLEL